MFTVFQMKRAPISSALEIFVAAYGCIIEARPYE